MIFFIKYIIVLLARFTLRIFYIFPVHRKRILFSAYCGISYTCNPKYIFETLFHQKQTDFEYIWVLNDHNMLPSEFIGKVKTVKFLSPMHLYYLLTSGMIISNLGIEPIVPKRKKQTFMNTWHGGGAYKRVSTDLNMISRAERYYMRKMRQLRSRCTDYVLSSCRRFTEVSSKDFAIDSNVYVSCGSPRNDRLFNTAPEKWTHKRNLFCQKHNIDQNSLLVLYAPTFRGPYRNPHYINNDVCNEAVISAFRKRFGKNVVFLYRKHISKNNGGNATNSPCMLDVTQVPDMQDLIEIADVLITDYSSSIWDYCLTGKPGFIYAPDLSQYSHDRGFYTHIGRWPYPYAETISGLCDLIDTWSEEENKVRIETHKKELGSYECGHASKTAAKIVSAATERNF